MRSAFNFLQLPLAHSFLALTLLCAGTTAAHAHKGSDAYLEVHGAGSGGLHFALSVAIKDLDLVVPLDANGDALVTWGEIRAAIPAVEQFVKEKVQLVPVNSAQAATKNIAECQLNWRMDGLETRSDGSYLRVVADPICEPQQAIALHYSLLREQDAGHRLMVAGQIDGMDLLMSISPTNEVVTLLRAAPTTGAALPDRTEGAGTQTPLITVWRYLLVGTEHLLEGYDHLAFLLALLLPLQLRLPRPKIFSSVTSYSPGGLQLVGVGSSPIQASPTPAFQSAPWHRLLRTVTAFTLGHSVTLILATLGFTSASPAWVEPAIAASIGATAWLNLYPRPWARTELLAGGFGLVHGYGFAGLLIDGAAPAGLLGWALTGFNLGVEVGQLIAVSGWVLLSQLAMDTGWYQTWVVRRGSWLLLALAVYWFAQRVQ